VAMENTRRLIEHLGALTEQERRELRERATVAAAQAHAKGQPFQPGSRVRDLLSGKRGIVRAVERSAIDGVPFMRIVFADETMAIREPKDVAPDEPIAVAPSA
jgi:hypothetical protein